jgi:hypothetical protein
MHASYLLMRQMMTWMTWTQTSAAVTFEVEIVLVTAPVGSLQEHLFWLRACIVLHEFGWPLVWSFALQAWLPNMQAELLVLACARDVLISCCQVPLL